MKKFFSMLLGTCTVLSSLAQSGGKVSGSIKDGGNQKTIDAASVSLLKAADSSLVKVAVADAAGNFSFDNVKDGNYLVLATSVGHAKIYSRPFSIAPGNLAAQVGILQLRPLEKNMKEVVVTAKKPLIERKLDKTIVNVEAAISNAGSTALEVLEKSPGVTVDKDGNVSLKGKQGVMVMIDGKPSYLNGEDLANLLRNMPSSNLDQIEIMTNPSAKYDAAGNAGIINIKTKKNKQKGFNGGINLAYGQGFYPKTNNSLNLNYRNGKFNFFSTISVNYRKQFNDLYIHREYKNPDGSINAIFDQSAPSNRVNKNYNAKLGMDFYASKKTTLGFVTTGFIVPNTQGGLNTSFLKDGDGSLDSIAQSNNYNNGKWKNGSVNLNFRHQFDSTGRELSADADYVSYKSRKDIGLKNTYYTENWVQKGSDELVGELPTDLNIYSIKVDYAHPLKNGYKFETGIKSSFVNTDNTAGYYNIIGGNKHVDYNKTNRFRYKENINAIYLNASKEFKKWSVQAGLRLENTNNDGYQFGNPQIGDSAFNRSYTGLFPNLFVNYNLSKNHQVSFTYGRRIRRPDYEDMNPFLFYIDNYTYDQGNPFLNPAFANTFELSHTFKNFLTTSVNYTHTRDLFQEVFEQKGFATVVTQRNYGKSDNASFSVSANFNITKWWTTQLYGEVNYNHYQGNFATDKVDIEATNVLGNVSNQFTIGKGWSAELSGFYRTKGIEGQIVIRPMGQFNAGVQKQILKKKATLKLNIRDFLNTAQARGYINFEQTNATFRQQRDNRVLTVSFSYRFGKPLKNIQKRKTGGSQDEQNRIKGGN